MHVKKKKHTLELSKTLFSLLRFVIIFGLAFIILKPFFIKMMMAFMHPNDLLDITVRYIPRNWSTNYWKIGFEILDIPKTGWFSLWTTVVNGILQAVSSALIGYGLARFNFPGQKLLYMLVIIIMLIPPQVYGIAQYLRFWRMGARSAVPLLLLGGTGMGLKQGLYIFLILNFFKGLPKDLENAALIDGASVLRAFFSVILPNARMVIVTIFVFSVSWQWTNTSFAKLYFSSDQVMAIQPLNFWLRIGLTPDAAGTMIARNAACLILMFPLLVLFLASQKILTQSIITSGQAN